VSVLAEHQSRVTIDTVPPIELPVSRQKITLDREWVPFVQASLTCPIGDGAVADIDPLIDSYIWATIHVRRLLGRTDLLSDLTRRYRESTLSDLTAEYDTLATATASLYHDYETPGHAIRSQSRDFRVIVRAAPIDWAAGEVSFELGGGESRLLEDANPGAPFTPPGGNKRAITNWVLARNNFPPIATPGDFGTAGVGDPEQAVWDTGQTAWEYLTQLWRTPAGSLQVELWCDEAGQWWIGYERPAGNGTGGAKPMRHLWSHGAERSVVNAVERRSRDEGFNAVILTYRAADGTIAYDVATTPGAPVRAHVETLDGRPVGRAAAMLDRAGDRGRALEILAVSDYAWTPGDRGTYHNPRRDRVGDVVAVEWNHPDDEMSIRLRKVS
jgi:hypothetical protein